MATQNSVTPVLLPGACRWKQGQRIDSVVCGAVQNAIGSKERLPRWRPAIVSSAKRIDCLQRVGSRRHDAIQRSALGCAIPGESIQEPVVVGESARRILAPVDIVGGRSEIVEDGLCPRARFLRSEHVDYAAGTIAVAARRTAVVGRTIQI